MEGVVGGGGEGGRDGDEKKSYNIGIENKNKI